MLFAKRLCTGYATIMPTSSFIFYFFISHFTVKPRPGLSVVGFPAANSLVRDVLSDRFLVAVLRWSTYSSTITSEYEDVRTA